MKRDKIDINLLRKRALAELSAEEKEVYDKWVQSSEKHKAFSEKAEYYFKENRTLDDHKIDTERAWSTVLPRLVRQRFVIPKWAGAAASLIVIALASYLSYMVVKTNTVQPTIVENTTAIQPGSKTAQLKLSNGSVVRLGEGSLVLKESDGTTINTVAEEVSYADNTNDVKAIIYNTIKVERGEEFTLTLADGTKVWINSMSELKFPVQFTGNERKVELLYGEVAIDAAHNSNKPFIVKTPVHDVVVLGTKFNVSCYANDGTVQTTLAEGSVRIDNITGQLESAEIKPDQQYVFDKQGLTASVKEVNADAYLAWTKGRFQFEDENLESIFKKLQRWYNVDVYFTNNENRSEVFNGRLPRFENIDVILSMIEEVSDVKIELKENSIIIK